MGNQEKSQASGMQKETRKQGAGKESGSSSFPLPSQLRHSLAHSLATQNGEVAPSPIRWTSYIKNSAEKFEPFINNTY